MPDNNPSNDSVQVIDVFAETMCRNARTDREADRSVSQTPLSDVCTMLTLFGPSVAAVEAFGNGDRTHASTSAEHRFDFMCSDAHGIVHVPDARHVSNSMPLPVRERARRT